MKNKIYILPIIFLFLISFANSEEYTGTLFKTLGKFSIQNVYLSFLYVSSIEYKIERSDDKENACSRYKRCSNRKDAECRRAYSKALEGRGMKLREGLELERIAAGMYKDAEGGRWRLVPVDREYQGKKAPAWYLQTIKGKVSQYQSGVFKTDNPDMLSADYQDELGVKHYLDIIIKDEGARLQVQARAAR